MPGKEATASRNMLHEFLTSNRAELIARCKDKVVARAGIGATGSADGMGIPKFLDQLVETLRREDASPEPDVVKAGAVPAPTEIALDAAQHGADLLRRGFTLDQVVHDYGNVCQSVTDLAIERDMPMGTHEFRTLNRCLDNAIADAVTAFARGSQQSAAEGRHEQANAFSNEHEKFIDIAIQSFSAIKTGNVGVTGATGALLIHALGELRRLAEHNRPEPSVATPTPVPATLHKRESETH